MFEKQETQVIKTTEIQDKARAMMEEGYRLVVMSCTKLQHFQVDYTFDKDLKFRNFRVELPLDTPNLPSISSTYFCSVLYENEIHDLFGIKFEGLALSFDGKFYQKEVTAPFANPQIVKKEEKTGKS